MAAKANYSKKPENKKKVTEKKEKQYILSFHNQKFQI